MRVAFLSDYISIHQKPFCDQMYSLIKNDFTFIATTKIRIERKKMGWIDFTNDLPYAIHMDNFSHTKFRERLKEYDVIIIGSSHAKRVQDILNGKLLFYYQERPLKSGMRDLLNAKRIWSLGVMILRQFYRPQLLCASSYCYSDYKLLHCFSNRAWKWGYFIEPIAEKFAPRANDIPVVLWVGRLIDCKHCEMVIEAASFLQKRGYKAKFEIVGTGEMESTLLESVKAYQLEDSVSFLGNLPNASVREKLMVSNIFLFTSDQKEGWGVVLNEAMSAGCCCIASDGAGSTAFLVKHGINGLIFKSGDQNELNGYLLQVLTDKTRQEELAKNAIDTMVNEWSPSNAAKRFIALIGSITEKRDFKATKELYSDGPCSPCA